ncbi:MAG: repeat-associated core domain protein, partial [Chthoniobacter sp.]|nr:repeat-associated core domain protein [Chthoniobacter sp.]
DISRIDAGDHTSRTPAFKNLEVGSWGVHDLTPLTAAPGEFDSKVRGAISALTIKGDFIGAHLDVHGSDFAPLTERDGKIGSLTIGGSLIGTARENGGYISATGEIGNVKVTGAVQGFAAADEPAGVVTGQDRNGSIFSRGTMGAVSVGSVKGGDGFESGQIASVLGMGTLTIANNIEGGRGEDSGAVGSRGVLGKVNVGGSVLGGSGERSGSILSSNLMQAVNIAGDVVGGSGDDSGFIAALGSIKSLTVGGSVKGGSGDHSGAVGSGGPLGAVVVTGDVQGGRGASSGQIVSDTSIKSVNVRGSVIGGDEFESGAIGTFGSIGAVTIGGDIVAGFGYRSGLISTEIEMAGAPAESVPGSDSPLETGGSIGAVTVNGSILGRPFIDVLAEGSTSGYKAGGIRSGGNVGAILIRGDVIGGDNFYTGTISSNGSITKVTVLGSVVGGREAYSGTIESSFGGDIGAVFVGGNIVGGSTPAARQSGAIYSSGTLGAVTIGDSSDTMETENAGSLIGGVGDNSGSIYSSGKMGAVTIHGYLRGGAGDDSGRIDSGGSVAKVEILQSLFGGNGTNSGGINALSIASVKITGILGGGLGANSGFIAANTTVGIVEASSIVGGDSVARPRIVAGDAIKTVTVADSISNADIIAGFYSDIFGSNSNPDALIGKVTIGTTGAGSMSGTNIVAGATTGTPATESDDGFFGTSDDAPIFREGSKSATSKIASVIIKGAVTGTAENREDHFGIVARTVGSIKVGGSAMPLKPGPFNDNLPVGAEGTDLSVRELGVNPPDGFVDRVVKFFDAGNGPFAGPYGKEIGGALNLPVKPSVIIGAPPASPVNSTASHVDFLSLPQGSYVIAEFLDEYIIDAPGADLFIQSLDDAKGEQADVYVGDTLKSLVKIKTIGEGGSESIDLAEAGYTGQVRFVKVVGLDNLGGAPGFDLVSVSGLNRA